MANEIAEIAVQSSSQPTNKVAATGTAAGGIAGLLAAAMAGYVGPAIMEQLGTWGTTNPSTSALLVAAVAALVGYFATKYGGQAAAFNVLDKPNVPMVPSKTAPKVMVVAEDAVVEPKVFKIEENTSS